MGEVTGTFAGAGGVALHYRCWTTDGARARALVALVHGFGEHSGRYARVVEHLVAHGYVVGGFDLRGHGRSPGARGHLMAWDEYRADVRAFLKHLGAEAPGIPLYLYGHSMGGLIVLEYALRHPEGLAGVVASAPLLTQPSVSPILLTAGRILSRVRPSTSMRAGLDASTISRDRAVVAAYRQDALVHSIASARLSTEIAAAIAWTQANAALLRVPLLIVHGSADRLVSPEGSRLFFEHVTLPDKERLVYEGGYHEPHNDLNAPDLLRDVLRWLDCHAGAREYSPGGL